MDAPIILTSSDLVDHTVLSRKRHETLFRRDFLIRNGAKPDEPHVAALTNQLHEVESKLKPLEDKLHQVDLLTVIPHRADVLALTAEINQLGRESLDLALKTKTGSVYELLKKRAAMTRMNFERREEIARLTILLNLMPRPEAESLRTLIESNSGNEASVSALPDEQQQELVNLLGRLGVLAFISSGSLTLDKKKVDGLSFRSWVGEVPCQIPNQGMVWITKDQVPSWEENEKHLAQVSRKIQALMAQRQAEPLSEEQSKEFDSLQRLYLELRARRQSISNASAPLSVSLSKSDRPHRREDLPVMDLGPAM